MEISKNLIIKFLKLLIFSLIFIFPIFLSDIFAYNQNNTHPALTDEIVDFYNLYYPEEQIPEEFKEEMKRGAIEEDTPPRWFNHFYDPIYKEGWLGYHTAKEWAISSSAQKALLGVAGIGILEGYGDYSYERALNDYIKGNKKRAFRALGHVFHLLEDSNVPEHTRGDTHIPIKGLESPYESAMAKWNPYNLNIAKILFDQKIKPVIFDDIDDYFDEVALYSNNYFFSEDTINITKYNKPVVIEKIVEIVNGEVIPYGIGRDKDGKAFHLVRGVLINWRNFAKEQKTTLDDPLVLNDYWDRLSRHLIPHGAGFLKLFLDQAKEGEKIFSQRKIEGQNFFSKILFGDKNDQITNEIVQAILNDQVPLEISESTPLPIPLPSPTISTSTPENELTQSPIPSPSPSPPPTSISSPLPSLTPSPSPLPFPSPSPTPSQLNETTSCPEPILKTNPPLQNVVINEIAWMGTEASANDEWIELKNNLGQEIDLNCWQIIAEDETPKIKIDSKSEKTKNTKISANGFYLLERTDDNTISNIPADQIYTGALSNSGEILKLYDKEGNLQDIVGNKDQSGSVVNWYYGDNSTKSSMERRDSQAFGADSSSWHTNDGITKNGVDAKGNQIKGTPRSQNSTGTRSLGGGFSGGSSSGSSQGISSGSGGSEGSENSGSNEGGSGGGGSGEGSNGGNQSGGDNESPLLKIVINEIAWMGTGASANDEWIELFNPSSQIIDLTGWTLKSFKIASSSLIPDTPDITFPSISIAPSQYLLLERTDDDTVSDIQADLIYTGSLDNSGEILELRDNTGQLQDKVGQLTASNSISPWYAGQNNLSTNPPTRKTMERIDSSKQGTDSSNWQTNNGIMRNGKDKNGNLLFGTPKKENSKEYSNVFDNSIWPMFGLNQNHTGQVSVNGPNTPLVSWVYDFSLSDGSYNLPFQPIISSDGSIFIIHTNSGGGGNLSVISNTGQLKWKWPQSGTYTLNRDSIPAVLSDNTVYLGAVSNVYALSSQGLEKWNICTSYPECNGQKAGSISFDSKGNVYFSDASQVFQKIKPDGSFLWKTKFFPDYNTNIFYFFGQTPIIDEDSGKIYLSGTTTSFLSRFFALDLNNGSVIWNKVWQDPGNTSETSPFSFDKSLNKLYSAARNAVLEIDPFDGQITPIYIASASDPFSRQPKSLVSIDSINNALLVAFDYSLVPSSSPDKLFPDTKTKIFSLNKSTKEINWTYEISLNLSGEMIVIDNSGNLYFSAEDIGFGLGKLYSLDKNGSLRWIFDPEEPATPVQNTNPIIDKEGALYQVFGSKLFKFGP